jgi:hypothetical protein
LPCSLHRAEESAGREESRREIQPDRLLPPGEGKLPDRDVLRWPDTGDGGACVQGAGFLEETLGLVLVRQVGLDELHRSQRLGAIAVAVVMRHHLGSFGQELANAGRSDSAGGTRD